MKRGTRKRCCSCGRLLGPTSFHRSRGRKDGLAAICRACKSGKNAAEARERRLPSCLKRRGIRDDKIRLGRPAAEKGEPLFIGKLGGALALIKDVIDIGEAG